MPDGRLQRTRDAYPVDLSMLEALRLESFQRYGEEIDRIVSRIAMKTYPRTLKNGTTIQIRAPRRFKVDQ